ncbi:MAG TPA: alpha/beta hydrolase [Pseudonocardiaceae bacterium]|jgi:pimeloyl-ACP methyl ester carboxylesterase|nr:alpha/beta hydrolase [Pseudonocardiaceae bacterium]
MSENLRTVTQADGRTLAYAVWGDPAGQPIFSLHGTPGSRLNRHPDDSKVAGIGARVITYDRPGYGASSRHHGRTIVDCVADVVAIADDLGLEQFAITGGSGGGPHCLAVAASLPERVTRAACVVGVAPYERLGDAFFDGMDPENIKEFGWALESESRLAAELRREADGMLTRMADDPATVLGDFDIPEADRAILGRPDIARTLREGMIEAVAESVSGWVDDDLAFTRPWGFEVESVTVTTSVWWGTHDVLVPAAHGEWLAAHVPGAITRIDSSGGHQMDPETRIALLYNWLLNGGDLG